MPPWSWVLVENVEGYLPDYFATHCTSKKAIYRSMNNEWDVYGVNQDLSGEGAPMLLNVSNPSQYTLYADKIFLRKNPEIPLIIDYEGKRIVDNFFQTIKYKELSFKNYPYFIKNDPKRQKKWHWRNWLYDFESWRGRRKL